MLSTIEERRSKIDRNSVFDCHLSPVWQQMASENPFSNDFRSMFLDSNGVLDCRLPDAIHPRTMINISNSITLSVYLSNHMK